MSTTINVQVRNKVASLQTSTDYAVCGNTDYLIHFDLDSEWSGYNLKTARFTYGSGYTDVAFTGTDVSLPFIQKATFVEIGLYAGSLHTTTPAILSMMYSTLSSNGLPQAPSPSVYEQLVAMFNAFSASVSKTGSTATITITDPSGTTTTTVSDGPDGDDGVGISNIVYNRSTSSGYVYTVHMEDGRTYEITTPIGPQGAKGDTGNTGNGIASIVFPANYTMVITMTDGTQYTSGSIRGASGANGADGRGIVSITKTDTIGLVDIYTILYTNGTTSTFTVTNAGTQTRFYLGAVEGEEQYRAFKDAGCTTLATAAELNSAMPNAIFDLDTTICFPLYFSYLEGVATIYFRIGDSDIEVTTA